MAHASEGTPRHVAIIMDGNGRWAEKRGQVRTFGHLQGVRAVRRAIENAIAHGVTHLSLFAFSTENWKRPAGEVSYLLDLMRTFIRSDVSKLKQQGVRVIVIGDRETLEQPTRALIEHAEHETSMNARLVLVIAFNYGGRNEIVRAVKRIVEEAKNEPTFTGVIDEACFADYLDTGVHRIPDIDLLIRTGGEKRISNFLLWQCAYAELVFVDQFWPDFNDESFADAIRVYSGRNRRFGAIPDHDTPTHAIAHATG